ncbi:hypothetical protein D8674_027227 [Pyrus ussuriensis x Pyrus communis]|uniref:MULE transposase domain-containing protein n=1 Tax=Pyrus ussuriensis x Pyrus communis TaxID=2448454 RepID=A0A5N5IC55_9ROSA|nr:hypothetical protein D8674_027227 [Pyrus ussuriensis x Pyrus communis]
MKSELKDNYGVKARYIQLWRGRQKAKEAMEGKHLRRYGNEVLKSNPGSIVKIQVDRNLGYPIFKRVFIFDGCFLKGPFGGQLLTAVSLDSSSGVFPIAMAIVELECTESWTFFMTHLETMIGSHNSDNIPWTFMSDRQKVALFLFCVFTVLRLNEFC